MVIDGHRPLREALEATAAAALKDQPTRDATLVLALVDNFENYRLRALLYAGRPKWRVLGSIVVR